MFFGGKKKQDKQGAPENKKSERRRLFILGAFALILVIIAAVSTLAVGHGGSLSNCTNIILSSNKYNCILGLANSTKNASICSYLPANMDYSCISNIALEKDSLSTCSMINSSSAYYSGCISSIAYKDNNIDECENISEPYESSCAYNISVLDNFSNNSYCSVIGNSSLQATCDYRYDYNKAIGQKNITDCSYIPNAQNYTLLNYFTQETSGLLGYKNETFLFPYINATPQEYCDFSIAVLSYNESICGITNGSLSLLCKSEFNRTVVVNQSTNVSNVTDLCSSVPQSVRSICVSSYTSIKAVQEKNSTICTQLSNQQLQNNCYLSIATAYKENEYCTLINNSTLKNICYYDVSNYTG